MVLEPLAIFSHWIDLPGPIIFVSHWIGFISLSYLLGELDVRCFFIASPLVRSRWSSLVALPVGSIAGKGSVICSDVSCCFLIGDRYFLTGGTFLYCWSAYFVLWEKDRSFFGVPSPCPDHCISSLLFLIVGASTIGLFEDLLHLYFRYAFVDRFKASWSAYYVFVSDRPVVLALRLVSILLTDHILLIVGVLVLIIHF